MYDPSVRRTASLSARFGEPQPYGSRNRRSPGMNQEQGRHAGARPPSGCCKPWRVVDKFRDGATIRASSGKGAIKGPAIPVPRRPSCSGPRFARSIRQQGRRRRPLASNDEHMRRGVRRAVRIFCGTFGPCGGFDHYPTRMVGLCVASGCPSGSAHACRWCLRAPRQLASVTSTSTPDERSRSTSTACRGRSWRAQAATCSAR